MCGMPTGCVCVSRVSGIDRHIEAGPTSGWEGPGERRLSDIITIALITKGGVLGTFCFFLFFHSEYHFLCQSNDQRGSEKQDGPGSGDLSYGDS